MQSKLSRELVYSIKLIMWHLQIVKTPALTNAIDGIFLDFSFNDLMFSRKYKL